MTPELLSLLATVGLPLLAAVLGRLSHRVWPATATTPAPALPDLSSILSLVLGVVNTLLVQPAAPAPVTVPAPVIPGAPVPHPVLAGLLGLLGGVLARRQAAAADTATPPVVAPAKAGAA